MSGDVDSEGDIPPDEPVHAPPVEIPYAFARRHGVVIAGGGETPDSMTIAFREGGDPRILVEVRRHVGREFDVRTVDKASFEKHLSERYAMDGAAAAMAGSIGVGDDLDLIASDIPTADDLLDSADDAPAIRLINGIIAEAARQGVSDIHIEPYETGLVVRMRMDGVLTETLRMPPHVAPVVVSRIKVMARLDIAERRVPQDGRIGLSLGG
jgi:general secretion pathway protein E